MGYVFRQEILGRNHRKSFKNLAITGTGQLIPDESKLQVETFHHLEDFPFGCGGCLQRQQNDVSQISIFHAA
jgi:hypothetical protein